MRRALASVLLFGLGASLTLYAAPQGGKQGGKKGGGAKANDGEITNWGKPVRVIRP